MSKSGNYLDDFNMTLNEAFVRCTKDPFPFPLYPKPYIVAKLVEMSSLFLQRFPHAKAETQIMGLRKSGMPLVLDIQWKFQTEEVFAGSTIWEDFNGMNILRVIKNPSLPLFNELLESWKPIGALSLWKSSPELENHKNILRQLPYVECMEYIKTLVEKGNVRERQQKLSALAENLDGYAEAIGSIGLGVSMESDFPYGSSEQNGG
jgi:hypothetical protein